MSRITVTVYKSGLNLESSLSRLTRKFQKQFCLPYKTACSEAEKQHNPVEFTQVIHSDSEELDLFTLGEHISKGAPFKITRE